MENSLPVSKIRSIFGENLKQLLEHEPSVAAFCRQVDINRTQFNRYISGSSSPRPEVLAKICEYFQVDARILLEPLSKLTDMSPQASIAKTLHQQMEGKDYAVDDTSLPDGVYRFWVDSHSTYDAAFSSLALISTNEHGTKVWKSLSKYSYTTNSRNLTFRKDSSTVGTIYGQKSGFAIIHYVTSSNAILFSYYRYGYRGFEDFCPGYSFVCHLEQPKSQRTCRAFLERLPQDFRSLLKIGRSCGYVSYDALPDYATQILRPGEALD